MNLVDKGVPTQELIAWLDQVMQPTLFHDYAPNGLQVQGKSTVQKVVLGVTASLDLIQKAIETQADALLVHHGWFWKNEDPRIIGAKYQRLAQLIKHDLNLIAYHLPLDAHGQYGNNAMLAKVLDFRPYYVENKQQTCGKEGLIWLGQPPSYANTAGLLEKHISQKLGRSPLFVGNPDQVIHTIAWCSGGAQSMFEQAIAAGADAYLTGEASEPIFHLAKEYGVAYYGAGHHATEKYGVQALGQALKEQFPSLDMEFINIENPV